MTPIELREKLSEQARAITDRRLAPNTRQQVKQAWRRAGQYSVQAGAGDVLSWGPEGAAAFAVWAVTHEPFEDERGRTIRPIQPLTLRVYLYGLDVYRTEHDVGPMCTIPVRDLIAVLVAEYGRPQRKAKSMSKVILKQVISFIGDSDRDVSDRTYILLQWTMWARRIEVARLNIEDIRIRPEGAIVTLRGPKEARGRLVVVRVPRAVDPELCAVRALEEHLRRRRATRGALFVSASTGSYYSLGTFSAMVRRRIENAGITAKGVYSTHSFRRGPINEALRQNWDLSTARRRSRHGAGESFEKYIDWAELEFSE